MGKKVFTTVIGDRKAAAARLAEITGKKAVYTRAPRFAYQVGGIFIERDGTVTALKGADLDPLRTLADEGLCEALVDQTQGDGQKHGQEPDTARTMPDTADSEATGLCISLPLAAVGVGNLTRLLEAKGSLIKKALGADDLRFRINEEDQTVEFPWWNELPDAVVQRDEVIAYTTFISLLCKMSREAKRVTAKEAEVENEKYAFRCFLLRLGFIGNEYKGMRKVLLRRLSGSAAFVTKDKADAFSAVQKAKRDAAKEEW